MNLDSPYVQRMVARHGLEKTEQILKSRSSKGGKTGGNGLQQLTKEQRSAAGKEGWQKMRATFTDEQWSKSREEARSKRGTDGDASGKWVYMEFTGKLDSNNEKIYDGDQLSTEGRMDALLPAGTYIVYGAQGRWLLRSTIALDEVPSDKLTKIKQ